VHVLQIWIVKIGECGIRMRIREIRSQMTGVQCLRLYDWERGMGSLGTDSDRRVDSKARVGFLSVLGTWQLGS